MNKLSFLQIQAIKLRELLQNAADNPILSPQLQERLDDIEEEIKTIERTENVGQIGLFSSDKPSLPRAAVFLRGGGVQGSEGIRPALAGESLIQYERMFIEQAMHDEREAARTVGRHRRPRGTPMPGLLFTGTPRGSFGLEFTPQQAGDEPTLKVHEQSLRNVANALVSVGNGDSASLESVVRQIPPRVLAPMKRFLKVLAQHGAELRLAFSDSQPVSLAIEKIKLASDLLERELQETEADINGTFRGVTRESGVFDLINESGVVITGTVADNLTEEDLERIDKLTNQSCVARIQQTIVSQVSGVAKSTYLLIDAHEPQDAPKTTGHEV